MSAVAATVGDRYQVLTDNQWELLELLLPKSDGRVGRNFSDNRLVVEGMLFRLRTGMPWRDLPEAFGPWQTVWKRHRRYARSLLTELACPSTILPDSGRQLAVTGSRIHSR